MNYDFIVVGCGFAGATIAERLANELDQKVLIIDKRNTIGGNMYDYINEEGIVIHEYGPHLFHTNDENVYNYLQKFGKWFKYEHRVLGKIKDKLVPIPFNLTSIKACFSAEQSQKLIDVLITKFGKDKKIPILELRKYGDVDTDKLADFVYENVFLYYTMKQWGKKPDEIDESVTARVPVYTSLDDRYFQDKYQYMPEGGYTKIFEEMLKSKNIELKLGVAASEILTFKDKIYVNGDEFKGRVIYTGALDELFDYEYGALPYRTLRFEFENINQKFYQPVGTVNYPTQEDKFTRITEFKHMTITNGEEIDSTVIMREYPMAYDHDSKQVPYYPINNETNDSLYKKYLDKSKKYDNLYLVGRLAQYKYYNMDLVIAEALKLYETIKGEI